MLPIRLSLAVLLLVSVAIAADEAGPAPAPARADIAYWLGHALREAADIAEPVRQAEAYAKAAVVMARDQEVQGYRRTIQLAEQALGRSPSKPEKSPVDDARDLATGPVLQALARSGDVAGAVAMAEERAKENKYSRPRYYAAVARGQVEAGDLDGALATAKALNEYDRRTALREIVSALAGRKDFAAARRVADMLPPRDSERRDAIRTIAAGLARAGEFDAALALSEQMPYPTGKQDIYRYVTDAHIKRDDFAAARATADRMPPGERLAAPHPAPDHARLQAYADIAWAQVGRKDYAGARATAAPLDPKRRAQVECWIAKAQVKAGDLAGAERTAGAIDRAVPASEGSPAPRDEAHQALARALARNGEIDRAAAAARNTRRPAATLLEVAEAATAQGKHEPARALARELGDGEARGGPFLFELTDDALHLRVARLQKELGDGRAYDDAVAALERAAVGPGDGDGDGDETGLSPRVSASMMLFALHVRDGNIEAARRVAKNVPPRSLAWVLPFMAAAAAESGRPDVARFLADLLQDPADRAAAHRSLAELGEEPPATNAEAAARIARLPTAYDRAMAHIARAEAAWAESQRAGE